MIVDPRADPNGLLNFTLPEIQKSRGPAPKAKPKSQAVPFQKERFMQANYKFAVCPNIYDHIADSFLHSRRCFDGTVEHVDKMLDNGVIAQVIFATHKPYKCVICLGPPCCPKISVCGHVFCWTCIIQYFSSKAPDPTIQTVSKIRCACPVCQAGLDIGDFRPVQIVVQEKCTAQQTVKFNLVVREKLSTLVTLYKTDSPIFFHPMPENRANFVQTRFPPLGTPHSHMNRVNVAFAQDMEAIWDREECELAATIKESLSSQDPCLPIMLLAQDMHKKLKTDFLLNDHKFVQRPPPIPAPLASENGEAARVFFYQENSGTLMFLHPINVRWLLREFGTQENLPLNIEGEVLLLEDEITQDELTKKRYRFLGHLPICCNFQFCLVDICSVLSPANQPGFKEEVEALKQITLKQAQQKQQFENHQQKQIQERYLKETAMMQAASQAVLYQKLSNPETVKTDSENFPSLGGSPTEKGPIPQMAISPKPNQKWGNAMSNATLLHNLHQDAHWESQTGQKSEAFPALGGGGPAPAAVKSPGGSWGKPNHIKDVPPHPIKPTVQRNNIVLHDHKY